MYISNEGARTIISNICKSLLVGNLTLCDLCSKLHDD